MRKWVGWLGGHWPLRSRAHWPWKLGLCRLLVTAAVGALTASGCALHYRESSAPSDAQLLYRVSAPTAAVGLTAIAVKVPWWARLAGYVSGGVAVRYGPCCKRPEGALLNVGVGAFVAEFIGLVARARGEVR